MELLLNLFWLTVALLTVGLWWRDARAVGSQRRGQRLSQFVVLSCGLILLFPVVSVTPQQNMRAGLSPAHPGSQITRCLHRRLPRSSRPRLTASVFTDPRHDQFLRQPEHIVCHWL